MNAPIYGLTPAHLETRIPQDDLTNRIEDSMMMALL
jgi:hypothetical protein